MTKQRDPAQGDPKASVSVAHKNTSVIFREGDVGFLDASLKNIGAAHTLVLTEDDQFLENLTGQVRLDFTAAGLDQIPIRFDVVRQRIGAALSAVGQNARIIVDMRWGLSSVSASANFERWGSQCDLLVSELGVDIISVYGRGLLIEDQLIAAFRGHSHFLSPSGLFPNPYWLPEKYLSGTTLTQQVAFLLGRLVPDYTGVIAEIEVAQGAASGADPRWLGAPKRVRPRAGSDDIWKIRCFGRLRIYLSDGSQIRWSIPGSAPKKSKALFAYLLQRGERGARAEQLSELLWGGQGDEATKRSRLHHAIAMLRKTLGGREFVLRTGDYYSLVPPSGTWIDIASFEQLCNRAKVLARSGDDAGAMTLLDAADRLYTGDLFEDLLPEYVESTEDDWVLPRRIWLKEMALKVHRDKAEILRLQGRLADALECCQKALAMDPTCEIAHAEAMRVFHAQNRADTVTRQYRQYRAAMEAIGAEPETDDLKALHSELLKSL